MSRLDQYKITDGALSSTNVYSMATEWCGIARLGASMTFKLCLILLGIQEDCITIGNACFTLSVSHFVSHPKHRADLCLLPNLFRQTGARLANDGGRPGQPRNGQSKVLTTTEKHASFSSACPHRTQGVWICGHSRGRNGVSLGEWSRPWQEPPRVALFRREEHRGVTPRGAPFLDLGGHELLEPGLRRKP